MTAEPHHFDADTALVPGDRAGSSQAFVPQHWFVGHGPNGGFLAALAARAAERIAERPLRSISLQFLAAPAVGPLDVDATVERAGRTTSVASVRITQAGAPMCLALATLGRLSEGRPGWDVTRPPRLPAPEDCEPLPLAQAGLPDFMRNYELRLPAAGVTGEDGGFTTGGWLRTTAPRALDGPLVAALTDAWMPAAYVALGRVVAAPTLDLGIHLRRALPEPGMEPADFVCCRFTTRLAHGGVWEEDGELWSPGGALLAQSRQLALVRERRA